MGRYKYNNGVCKICGEPVNPEPNTQKNGKDYMYTRAVCHSCRNFLYRTSLIIDKYKLRCERCGWSGYCDRHHKDGNHNNDETGNIEYLCPNCHRTHHSPLNPKLIDVLEFLDK